MYCRNCGHELNGKPKICLNCGVKPSEGTSFCTNCGKATDPLAVICTSCKAKIPGRRTWKPITAGVLNIIGGFLYGTMGVLVAIGTILIDDYAEIGLTSQDAVFALLIGMVYAGLGLLGLIGGLTAVFRKSWFTALLGASSLTLLGITFYFVGAIPGILAIIWIVMSKKEFS